MSDPPVTRQNADPKGRDGVAPGFALPLLLAGGISFVLGVLVLVGWHLHYPALVQVLPGLVPMQYNTALGFIISGAGLVAIVVGRRRLALGAGLLVAALGFLTLLEYLVDMSLGIDQLLFTADITARTSQPGRMSPLTAMGFVLTGGALVLLAWPVRHRRRVLVMGTLGSLLTAMGSFALLGYLSGRSIGYVVGPYTDMAVHTAAGFVALGWGVFSSAWREAMGEGRGAPRWLPLPIAVGLLAVTLVLWQGLSFNEAGHLDRATEVTLAGARGHIPEAVKVRIQPLVRMAGLTEQGMLLRPEQMETDAHILLDDDPSLRAIGWADPSFTVRQIVPLAGNEMLEGLNLGFEESRRLALEAARAGAEVAITRTVGFVRGGEGFLAVVPVRRGQGIEGFVVGFVDTRHLLDSALARAVPGYSIVVREDGNEIYRRSGTDDPRYEREHGRQADVDVYGVPWQVRVWPGAEAVAAARSPLPEAVLALGAIMSLLMATLVGLAQTSRLRAREAGAANQDLSHEVAERKKVEERLLLFRALVDRSTDAIEVIDPETGRFLDMNNRGCSDLGYTHEEILSLSIFDIDPEVDPATFALAVDGLRESGSRTQAGVHVRKDGSTFPVEVNITVVQMDREYVVAVVRDTTDRKAAEAEHMLLSAAVEQATDSVVVTDVAGVIQYVNPTFERTTGYSREEVVGQTPRILKSGKHDAEYYRDMWDTLTRGAAWTREFINRRKDGTLYEEQESIFPIIDADGTTVNYVSIGHDMTHERALEAKLRQSQKMETVGRLAGGVAHDFNNVLTVISVTTELMLADIERGDEHREGLEEISEAVRRAAGLTRQLLAFSRQQVIDPRVIDLNTLIADTEKMLARLIREDIEFRMVLQPGLGSVRVDVGQIEQVIMNLVVNARDAMPLGGKLTIETEDVELDESYMLGHEGVRPGRYVMLAVSDDGGGMDAETQARVFEPFFTTKEIGKGTGLGLATAYGIVKQNEGYIWLDSEVGHGTTIKTYWPRIDAAPDVPEPSPEAPASLRGSATVLLAEDDRSLRGITASILESLGYRVLSAADGDEALRLAAAHDASIDLLVTDVVMPGMGGRELSRRLGAERPGVKTLYVSGYAGETIAHHGVLETGIALLEKPFTREGLARKVHQVLSTR